jgi:hypothetical protein
MYMPVDAACLLTPHRKQSTLLPATCILLPTVLIGGSGKQKTLRLVAQ